MNSRLEKIADRALKGNGAYRLEDVFLRERFEALEANERPDFIRKEYAKLIDIDEESLLAGDHPVCSVPFLDPPKRADAAKARETFLGKGVFESYMNELFMFGGNHLTADFDCVLKSGISGIMVKIEEAQRATIDEDKKAFLDNLYRMAQAVISWVLAYVDAIRVAAEAASSAERREELTRMADICERVPNLPATSFREAIQSYYFTFILMPDGLGCIDRYLYPYYISDLKAGKITRKEALDLTEELFLKIFCRLGKDEIRSGNNHGVVGGYTPGGECGHNEYTSVVLEAITEIPVWRPQISYRVTAKTTMEQLREAVEAQYKRPDLVMLLNDDVIIKGLIEAGVAYEDAVGYSATGCNETVLTGCSQPGALQGLINTMHSLEHLLKDVDKLEAIQDFEAFYKVFEEYLKRDLDIVFKASFDKDAMEAEKPRLMCSLLTEGCISSASSISRGGAKYNFCTWSLTGLVNLADSLSILRQTVFEEKRFTLKEISRFLEKNWVGYEKQRAYILNKGRYFGNDYDDTDMLINKVSLSINRFAESYTPYRGGRYLFGTLTGYEVSHVIFGKNTSASIDGRYAGEPLCASITAFPGADRNGVTAYLKSAAKIDGNLIKSSTVVNLSLDRAVADSEEKRERLTALLHAYFKQGGIQLQINYLSADELIKAQKEPEKHRELRVRVTGFSGFFTSFDKDLQNEIICRRLHAN